MLRNKEYFCYTNLLEKIKFSGRYGNSGRYGYCFLEKVQIGMLIQVGTFIRDCRVVVASQ